MHSSGTGPSAMSKVRIKIDDVDVLAEPGTTVLEASRSIGHDIPSFCYHPKLSIAGNCRMCLVQIKGQPKPVISCREKVREGMEIDTRSPEVKKVQQGVLEFILVNHPLDCPICDQSGECDLQDNYFKFSNTPSRLEDPKIHKPKAKPLGPHVTLDDERCIVCTRCVRFCDEVAKEHELCVTERGGHSTLTTYPGKELKNPYSLNTVDVCPVGALTSTDFRFKKRVWFLKTASSICTGCATGCNIRLDWDDQKVYRYRPRENEAVNECWMCDEGRLSYKFINDVSRVLEPLRRNGKGYERMTLEAAVEAIAEASQKSGKARAVVSAQASCEENFALAHFVRENFSESHLTATSKEVSSPSSDDFLIDPDKNPNRKFTERLKADTKMAHGGIYFVLENLTPAQISELKKQEPEMVVWFASNRDPLADWADIIIPKPTFAEQDGTFINRKNRLQRAWQAFEPRGLSRPVWGVLSEISRYAGFQWNFENAEEVFAKAFKGIKFVDVGDLGIWIT